MYRTDFTSIKIPRTREDFEDLLQDVAAEGYYTGRNEAVAESRAGTQEKTARTEALKVLTEYAKATGQTMAAFSRAMESEHGQL